MNVGDLKIELRPRTSWEALDLGFAVGREWFGDLWKIGAVFFLPVWLLLLACFWKYPYAAMLLIWWAKPLYDRFHLYYLSQRVFGKEVNLNTLWKQRKALLWTGLLPLLTIRRLSPWRSMILPISDLEGLKGGQYARRAHLIKKKGGQFAALNTMTFLKIEGVTQISLFILFLSLVPQNSTAYFDHLTFFFTDQSNWAPRLLNLVGVLSYCLIILVLEPIYVATGFSLYLNSRTEQELWDVELRFRELGARLRKTTFRSWPAALLLLGLCWGGAAAPLRAETRTPELVIKEVLEAPEFQTTTITTRRWVPSESDINWESLEWLFDLLGAESQSSGVGLGNLVVLLGWATLAALLILLLYFLRNYLGASREKVKEGYKRPPKKAEMVLGMKITRDSLPSDVVGSARALWQQNQPKEALSLLYRGTLYSLVENHGVEIASHYTEGECVRAAEQKAAPPDAAYLKALSRRWVELAYHSQRLADHDFLTLCQRWPFSK